jgi:hypothetical protein
MMDDEIRQVPVVFGLFQPASDSDLAYSGQIEVVTESGSRYLLDLDLELLKRIRGTEQPADPEVAFPSKLRDHARGAVRLLRVIHLKVGERAVFDIESLSENPLVGYTRRTTTCVVAIHQIGDRRQSN